MSKLVFSFEQDQPLQDGASVPVTIAVGDDHMDKPLLLARRTGSVFLTYVALGTLRRSGDTAAEIADVVALPVEVQSFRVDTADMFEISDGEFDDAVARGTGALLGHEMAQLPIIDDQSFTAELSARYRNRCSFSDVRTYRGSTVMIQPLSQGGALEIGNCLFLDPEPGQLFTDFAWSVGPRFEIVIDAHATGSNVADTVNRTGMLALPDRVDLWPNRDALAWHFDQFTQRLKTSTP